MRFLNLFALGVVLTLAGCHSAYVAATVSNHTAEPLSLIEVDYPSASFGTQSLAPGQDFHYRFKIIGSGPTTVLWTDADHRDHKNPGPTLHEGDEGSLAIIFTSAANPTWNLRLLGRTASR